MSQQKKAWIIVAIIAVVILAVGGTVIGMTVANSGSNAKPTSTTSPSPSSTSNAKANVPVDVTGKQLITLIAVGTMAPEGTSETVDCSLKGETVHLDLGGSVTCVYSNALGASAKVTVTLAEYAVLVPKWNWTTPTMTPTPVATGTGPATYPTSYENMYEFIKASVVVPTGVAQSVMCPNFDRINKYNAPVGNQGPSCAYESNNGTTAVASITMDAGGTFSAKFSDWKFTTK